MFLFEELKPFKQENQNVLLANSVQDSFCSLHPVTRKVTPRQVAPACSGSWLEMQGLRPTPNPLSQNLHFHRITLFAKESLRTNAQMTVHC